MREVVKESSAEQVRALEESLAPLTKDAGAPADLRGQPGLLHVHTYYLAAGLAVCVGLGFLGGDAPIFAWLLGIPVGLFALGSFVSDLTQPSARSRRRSEDAVRCYFKAVKRGRWDTAHACLSKRARDAVVHVPAIDKLGSVPAESVMTSPYGVKRYWATLTRSGAGYMRSVRRLAVVKVSGSENVHRYRVRLEIQAYHQAALLLLLLGLAPGAILIYLLYTRNFRTEFEVFVFRHKSQWWLVSGELGLLEQVAELPKARVVS